MKSEISVGHYDPLHVCRVAGYSPRDHDLASVVLQMLYHEIEATPVILSCSRFGPRLRARAGLRGKTGAEPDCHCGIGTLRYRKFVGRASTP